MATVRAFLLLFVATLCAVYYAQGACDINTGAFGQLGLVQQLGFFSLPQVNLQVCHTVVTGSIPGYNQLRDGVFDVFTGTLTDNAFSRYYAPNLYPGESMVMLGETGINSPGTIVGVRYNITSPEQLRGTNILVDSPTSGFILTLRRILALYNLFFERNDYQLISLGANRFPGLYAGFVNINGNNVPISATVVSPPQGTQLVYDPEYFAPQVRSLGELRDYVNPIAGSSVQTKPENLRNTTLRGKIVRLLAAFLLANRFARNPDNQPYLLSSLRTANPTASESYIRFLYDYTYGSEAGLSNDYQFNVQGLLNAAYIKQQFGGSPYNQSNYGELITQTGIIDYAPRDDALSIVNAVGSVQVSVTSNLIFPADCIYPSKDKYIQFTGVLQKLLTRTSGGCTSPIRASFLGCSSNSTFFYPAQCSYNAATDVLTFNGDLDNSESERYYFTQFSVREPCGGTFSLTQTTVLHESNPNLLACSNLNSLYQ